MTEGNETGLTITGLRGGETVPEGKLVIPEMIDGKPVTVIGKEAFKKDGLKEVTLPKTVLILEEGAFRDNQIKKLDLSAVEKIGPYAFSNNSLTEVKFEKLKEMGHHAFAGNRLIEVALPDSVESFGEKVFTQNGRFVKVNTSSSAVRSERDPQDPSSYGHIKDPITAVVVCVEDKYKDEPEDIKLANELIPRKVIGHDLTDPNAVFVESGVPFSYKRPLISDYLKPTDAQDQFTVTKDGEIIYLYYISSKEGGDPVIEMAKEAYIELNGDGSEATLLSFVKAKDSKTGEDLSAYIEASPKQINDTTVPGIYNVTFSVTNSSGKTVTKDVPVRVATEIDSLHAMNIGGNWTLGDFTYEGNMVTGFSESGMEKIQLEENKDLILPHINPNTGEGVDTINCDNLDRKAWGSESCTIRSIRDVNGNIHHSFWSLGESGDPPFYQRQLESIDLPNLKNITY